MENVISRRIRDAIAATKKVVPGYFEKTVAQRLSNGVGSVTTFSDATELENALLSAEWFEFNHPAVMAGCVAYATNDIVGEYGIVELRSLASDVIVTLDDRKGTGKVSCTVQGVRGQRVSHTVIMLGDEQGVEVVFTFHPGDPVKASQVTCEPGMHGRKVTVSEALDMGLETAKIVA